MFTLDRLPLLLLLYTETSSSAVQKRHSKVRKPYRPLLLFNISLGFSEESGRQDAAFIRIARVESVFLMHNERCVLCRDKF